MKYIIAGNRVLALFSIWLFRLRHRDQSEDGYVAPAYLASIGEMAKIKAGALIYLGFGWKQNPEFSGRILEYAISRELHLVTLPPSNNIIRQYIDDLSLDRFE